MTNTYNTVLYTGVTNELKRRVNEHKMKLNPGSFKGLYYGIRAINSDPTNLITLNKSNFEGNFRGVYVSNMSQPQITLCNFTLPYQSSKIDTIYGLYLGKSTGYKVQENLFRSPGNHLLQGSDAAILRYIGIVVDSSGALPNEIYNNTFDTLDIAINAQRRNKSSAGDSSGLVLKCNKYNNNVYDEMITLKLSNNGQGIAAKQGAKTSDKKDAAGNTFSPYHGSLSLGSGAESDIKNRGEHIIYFHTHTNPGDPRVRPDRSDSTRVSKSDVLHPYDILCCPSNLNNGGGLPDDMKGAISSDQGKIDSLTTVLNSEVDGGNTEGLNTTVFFSQPPESLQIRQDLLDQSPYLSDTVMKSAINKENVLPNEMIRDVLVANPQAAKSDNVLGELNTRFIPMPDPMMDEIMNGKDSLSNKEALEAELSLYKLDRQYSFDELVRYYKTDTINPEASHDSLMALLSHEQYPETQYMLAFEYSYMGDWNNVNNVLDYVSNNLHLSYAEMKQHEDYVLYFGFLRTLSDQGRNIYQLSTVDITGIQQLVAGASEPIKTYAQNILEGNGLLKYYEPILLPENLKSKPEKNSIKTRPFSVNDRLRVFPNPARQYVIVEYNLSQELSGKQDQILFLVSTSDGKIIENKVLSKTQDQLLVNTTNYSPGIYLFSIQLAGKILNTRKVTVTN